MTRVFIAIDFPEKIIFEIEEIQKKLPEFNGKFVEPENLHLTLKFLGDVDDTKLSLIKEKLKKINFEPVVLKMKSIGVFSEDFIRIVWLHVSGCDDLQKQIDKCLEGIFPKEKRFMSHLTIARVKSTRDKKDFLNKLKEIKIPELSFKTANFKLKKSVLTKERAFYENLNVFHSYSHKD